MSALVEPLAAVACDAFFEVADMATRWPSATNAHRATFRAMAIAALAAGQACRGREPAVAEAAVARALSAAFLAGADCPEWMRRRFAWGVASGLEREVFLRVARKVIAAGQRLRQAQAVAA